jgi:hypothetical protein
MKDEEIPTLISESILEIGDKKLRCYILSDGRRIVNADDIHDIFGFERLEDPNKDSD